MAKNEGKKFEEDFMKSCPEEWFIERLKDSSGSWSKDESKSRFTPKNMGDLFLFNTDKLILYCVECKSFKGKSMSYKNLNDKKDKKINKLIEMSFKRNCCGGYALNFRDLNKTYWIDAYVLKRLKEESERKSISFEQARNHGELIPQKLKRVRYKYDLKGVF